MKPIARLVAVAVCAAVLCPVAAAVDSGRLASMPLPRETLGADAIGLALLADSGVDSNADAAGHAGGGVTGADLASSGRITGYTLDYALPVASALRATGSLLGVQTIAELYRDGPAATKGLAFWRGVTRALNGRTTNGVTIRLSTFRARVGAGAFAFELAYRLAGRPIFYVGDVVFRTGALLGAVFVTAGDETGLRVRTVDLAHRLAARIDRIVAGKPPASR